MIIKLGETSFSEADFQSVDSVVWNPEILESFQKTARDLKAIAPMANDFLYFSCIMMHAAEASLLDEKGNIKKDAKGNPLSARWEKSGDSIKWVCSDPAVLPYRNSNKDIFPEHELVQAHKLWVGKPLCLDHKSSSVDMVRGVIVDTYYDRPNKRVVALCALDKINYPDLARKVSTGTTTCVSMGTAVSAAICTDCGCVARVESDFCNHMRTKSGYGEINTGLNPIELSIVVNGADPKAKIRHIVAAYNSLAQYVNSKEVEFLRLASEDNSGEKDKVKEILSSLNQAVESLNRVKTEIEGLISEPAADSDDKVAVASAQDNSAISKIEEKLETIFNKISELCEEKSMSKKEAYFQGGGGVNEPAPKQVKYPKEEADKVRETEDKQMVGQMNTGPVDGMHPGYESFGESEEARKRRLQRLAAEKEERAIRRQAALDKARETVAGKKEAYFQGGGGDNEPTPHKVKYPKEDADSIREKEDKQMTGQAPFPGVGSVDGLHPSPASAEVKDELKRKQMLSRAKLNAKFIKAASEDGTDDLGNSRWQVYADGKLVLTATVNEITGGRTEALYDSVATRKFGENLLAKVRSEGLEKVASALQLGVKSAQLVGAPGAAPAPVAPPVAEAPAAPTPAPAALPVADDFAGDEAVDAGGVGDAGDTVPALLDDLDNLASDLRRGFDALQNQTGNELDVLDQDGVSEKVAGLAKAKRKVAAGLALSFKKLAKAVDENRSELQVAKDILVKKPNLTSSQRKYAESVIASTCEDAQTLLSEGTELMGSFVKFARSVDLIVKKASAELTARAQVMPADKITAKPPVPATPAKPREQVIKDELSGFMPDVVKENTKPVTPPVDATKKAPTPAPSGWRPSNVGGQVRVKTQEEVDQDLKDLGMKADDHAHDESCADDCGEKDSHDVKMNADGSVEGTADEIGQVKEKMAGFDLSTKEGRAMYREKLAEKGFSFHELLGKAHKGGVTPKLDIKPTGDLAKVETLEETHKAMMDILSQATPKVRKQAEEIQRLVVAKEINPEKDFDYLVAEGLDAEAVKYWKQYFGQAKDGGSQFAAELVKEHATKKAEEENEAYRVKIARSYEVASTMARKGMISGDTSSVKRQVDELMQYNDAGFQSFQRWVDSQPGRKIAEVVPQVGLIGNTNVFVPAPQAKEDDLVTELTKLWDR